MTTTDAQTVPMIQVEIPRASNYYRFADRMAVDITDISKISDCLDCCDAALVSFNKGIGIDGIDYYALMALIADVRGMLHGLHRRFEERDVLPNEERPSDNPVPGAGNKAGNGDAGGQA